MSDLVWVNELSPVWTKVQCTDAGIMQELIDLFTFEVPNAKFHPLVRAKRWDGKIRLMKPSGLIYTGLIPEVQSYCEANHYVVSGVFSSNTTNDLDIIVLKRILKDLKDTCGLVPRDYQLDGLLHVIKHSRAILISPTASGKSLIIHLIIAYFDLNTLLVVPTQNLVLQMQKDLISYGVDESRIQIIMEGRTKDVTKPIVISTWQSLATVEPDWFDRFGILLIDEVHTAKAKSLTKIAEKCSAVIRVGTTGTLDNIVPNMLSIVGLFGPVKQLTTTKVQMDKGNLAKLVVKLVRFNYAPSDRKELSDRRIAIRREQKTNIKKATAAVYADEIDFLIGHQGRRDKIVEVVRELKGNTMVLFHRVEKDGKLIYEALKEALPDHQVLFASGETPVEERDDIRKVLEDNSNVIVVASITLFSTGVNIRNLHNAVAVAPTKSLIRVLQSIGRTLRLHDSKDAATWVDIVDDLTWGSHDNYAVKHAAARIRIYEDSEFDMIYAQKDIW